MYFITTTTTMTMTRTTTAAATITLVVINGDDGGDLYQHAYKILNHIYRKYSKKPTKQETARDISTNGMKQ
jgi:hypothetical protein